MRARLVAVAIAGALLGGATIAKADCSRGANCLGGRDKKAVRSKRAPKPKPPATEQRYWYGWQLVLVDSLALGTFGVVEATDARGAAVWALGLPAVLTYKVVPPIIHWRHDRGAIAWASFGLRDGLPSLGYISGFNISGCAGALLKPRCDDNGPLIGMVTGMIAASILDAALLSRDAPVKAKPPVVRWSPLISVDRDDASLQLVGSF